MTALNKFLEPVEIAGKPFNKNFQAYRMDDGSDKPDMRKEAGLGECNSCDYFVSNADSIILIEETKLQESIKTWKNGVAYLNEDDQKDFVSEKVKTENRLKVYGSLLVLARLMNKFPEVRNLVDQKKICFWLVVSGLSTSDDKKYIDNLKDHFITSLGGALSREVIDKVEVFASNYLADKLAAIQATP